MYIKFKNCSFANKNKISYLKRTKKVKTKKRNTSTDKKLTQEDFHCYQILLLITVIYLRYAECLDCTLI